MPRSPRVEVVAVDKAVLRLASLASLFVTAAAPLGAGPAQDRTASPEASQTADDIVVTGQRRRYSEAVADVRRITKSPEDVFARFEQPICPLALGVSATFARAIERRIAKVAEAVGVQAAGAGCRANLTLVVADDGAGAIQAIQKKRPNLLMSLTGAELHQLKSGKGPVWSWYDYDQKRRDGGSVEHISFLDGSPPRPVSPHAYIVRNAELSRLTAPIRLDMMLAFVVVDSRSVEGLTVRQLADSAAMMGLSMIRYQAVPQLAHVSVLQLFGDRSSRARIDGLTAFDRAYLSALYSGEAGIPARRRSAQMAAGVLRAGELGSE